MKQGMQAVSVGIFFILGLGLLYTVYTTVGNKRLTEETGYILTATFDDLKTLTPGSDVRMAGVRIGQVKSTGLNKGKGLANLQIRTGIEIPSNSIATIAIGSLLGQNYIAVEYVDSPGVLKEGNAIRTKESTDLNDIMGKVGELGDKLNNIADSFSGFGGDGMNDLFSNLNSMVTENRSQIDTVIDNLEKITTQLTETEGTLGKLINDDSAYTELTGMMEEIKSTASDARSVISDIKSGQGTIGQLLYDDKIAKELEVAVANLSEFSSKLNSGEGTLGKLVTDDELYRELRSLLSRADQALDSVGDSGPITAVGAASGVLF